MQLLYCREGVQIALHDDTQAAVPASAYGDGVRIIPLPADKMSERPIISSGPRQITIYGEPEETTPILLSYAAQLRFSFSNIGFTFQAASGPIPVNTDRMNYMLLGNLATFAATVDGAEPLDFTQESINYVITATECKSMFVQCVDLVQKYRTVEAECIADLTSAAPTLLTYEDVDAKFAAAFEAPTKEVQSTWR